MPWLVIVAGPNGSGKTTLVRTGVLARALPEMPEQSINPDDIARALAGGGLPTDAQSLQAAQLADAALDTAIAAGRSVVVETVLSSDKLQRRVDAAHAAGYRVALVYVTLRGGDLNVARVAQRLALGGHDVASERVLARRARSHAQFAWFAREAELVLVYDNTEVGAPVRAAGKLGQHWRLWDVGRLPADLAAEVRRLAGSEPPQRTG